MNRACLCAFALAALLPPATAVGAKTDAAILQNGDHITGEVKGLARGKLDYSTDDAGRLSIEWEKLARLTSPHSFHLELDSGERYLGSLGVPDRDGRVVVQGARIDTLALPRIVEITPLNAAFLQRLIAYFDLGFTLAKANQATTFSLSGAADYRGESVGSQTKFDSYAQGQESVPTTTRNSVRQSVSWYLPHRWSVVGLAQLEQNDELDLDHRVTAGGGISRMVAQSNRMDFSLGAGLVGTQEQFTTDTGRSSDASFEGLLAMNWDMFRFDSPKLDFNTGAAVYPSISDAGRVRGQLDFRLTYEVFKDFNTGVRFSDTFDSRPPDAGASKNDYITTLTIGWSYRR